MPKPATVNVGCRWSSLCSLQPTELHRPAKTASPWPLSSTRIFAPRALPISTTHSARPAADIIDAASANSSTKRGVTSPRGGVAPPPSTRRFNPA